MHIDVWASTREAIQHFEVALEIASSFNWHNQLFRIHRTLAKLFLDEQWFDDAQDHIERAKSPATNSTYYLGRTMHVQAELWYKQDRLQEARAEALRAIDVYEKLGAVRDLKMCRRLLRVIERKTVKQDS